jgi:hypothetical protein
VEGNYLQGRPSRQAAPAVQRTPSATNRRMVFIARYGLFLTTVDANLLAIGALSIGFPWLRPKTMIYLFRPSIYSDLSL